MAQRTTRLSVQLRQAIRQMAEEGRSRKEAAEGVGAQGNTTQVARSQGRATCAFMSAFDRQVAGDFAIGGHFTWRHMGHFDGFHPTGVDGTDFVQTGTFICGSVQTALVGACSIPIYGASAASVAAAASVSPRPIACRPTAA